MNCNLLIGIVIGAIIASVTPNPFIWLEEKYQDHERKKRHFANDSAKYICDDHCFWGYEDCPHCKKDQEGT